MTQLNSLEIVEVDIASLKTLIETFLGPHAHQLEEVGPQAYVEEVQSQLDRLRIKRPVSSQNAIAVCKINLKTYVEKEVDAFAHQLDSPGFPTYEEAVQNRMEDLIITAKYKLYHQYDTRDRSVCFEMSGMPISQVKNLAAYVQFKAEAILGDTVSLDNVTVVQFLVLHGAKIVQSFSDSESNDVYPIDIYSERESRICKYPRWYNSKYPILDSQYGESAETLILEKSVGKTIEEDLI